LLDLHQEPGLRQVRRECTNLSLLEDRVTDFVEVTLDDGTKVLFQTLESELVKSHSGGPEIEKSTAAAMDRIGAIALATESVHKSFREKLKPDQLTVEIGIGLSGEVGWFFAKSEIEASIKVTINWKSGSND
jgi:Trypsin-co-occurring domain 1